jgi:hypothetical protein
VVVVVDALVLRVVLELQVREMRAAVPELRAVQAIVRVVVAAAPAELAVLVSPDPAVLIIPAELVVLA